MSKDTNSAKEGKTTNQRYEPLITALANQNDRDFEGAFKKVNATDEDLRIYNKHLNQSSNNDIFKLKTIEDIYKYLLIKHQKNTETRQLTLYLQISFAQMSNQANNTSIEFDDNIKPQEDLVKNGNNTEPNESNQAVVSQIEDSIGILQNDTKLLLKTIDEIKSSTELYFEQFQNSGGKIEDQFTQISSSISQIEQKQDELKNEPHIKNFNPKYLWLAIIGFFLLLIPSSIILIMIIVAQSNIRTILENTSAKETETKQNNAPNEYKDIKTKVDAINSSIATTEKKILSSINVLSANKNMLPPSDTNKSNETIPTELADLKSAIDSVSKSMKDLSKKGDIETLTNDIVAKINNSVMLNNSNNQEKGKAGTGAQKGSSGGVNLGTAATISDGTMDRIATKVISEFAKEMQKADTRLKIIPEQKQNPELLLKKEFNTAMEDLKKQLPQKKVEENTANKFTGPKGYFAILLANSRDFPVEQVILETITKIADNQLRESNNEQKVSLYVASTEKLEEIHNPISKVYNSSKGLSLTDPNSTEKLTDISKLFLEKAFFQYEKNKGLKIDDDGRKVIIIANSDSNAPDAGKAGEWDKISKVDVILVQKNSSSTFFKSSEWLNFVAQKNGRIMIVQGNGKRDAGGETMKRLSKSLEHLLNTRELR